MNNRATKSRRLDSDKIGNASFKVRSCLVQEAFCRGFAVAQLTAASLLLPARPERAENITAKAPKCIRSAAQPPHRGSKINFPAQALQKMLQLLLGLSNSTSRFMILLEP
jgi:hypothetical protein